jgi:hypothetical protein
MVNAGFNIPKPQVEYCLLSEDMLDFVKSRDFGHPYKDINEKIGGNLYLWLSQSYKVLWRVDEVRSKILIYTNACDKVGERFSTLLKLPKEEGKLLFFKVVNALALANYLIEKAIYNIEGNWLLKNRNSELNGLLKYFVFWLASIELKSDEKALNYLYIFIKKFAKDVDLQLTSLYSEEAILNTAIQCFFYHQNEITIFVSALKKPNIPIHDL